MIEAIYDKWKDAPFELRASFSIKKLN
jgi:hypothetical protein